MKNKFQLLTIFAVCLFLISVSFGCLGADTYKIKGKIMMEDGTQPFENADIYIDLVDITDSKNVTVLKSLILENGEKQNYTYTLEYAGRLEPKRTYIVSAFIDIDGNEEKNDGDYVSKVIERLEPNVIEHPYNIYVYPYED